MLICRTPFRLSLFGGGTDFPRWYNNNSGLVISTSINKYCYVILRVLPPFFEYKYRLRYFKNEMTPSVKKIKHRSIKAIIENYNKNKYGLEIIHSADLPAMSGLGSSSATTVSLINLMNSLNLKKISKRELSLEAINVEQNILKENVGSQDQFACAFGGFNSINFSKTNIDVNPMLIKSETKKKLMENITLFFTGYPRKADIIEKNKFKNMKGKFHYYKDIYEIALEAQNILYNPKRNFLNDIGKLMRENWIMKKSLSNLVSNSKIDEVYNYGIKNGAIAGKLTGAGGGGFMLFLTSNKKDKKKLQSKLQNYKLVDVNYDETGSQIIYHDRSDRYQYYFN